MSSTLIEKLYITGLLGVGTFGVVHSASTPKLPPGELELQRSIQSCAHILSMQDLASTSSLDTVRAALADALKVDVAMHRPFAIKSVRTKGIATGSRSSARRSFSCMREADALCIGRQLHGATVSAVIEPFATRYDLEKARPTPAVGSWSFGSSAASLLQESVTERAQLAIHMATEMFPCTLSEAAYQSAIVVHEEAKAAGKPLLSTSAGQNFTPGVVSEAMMSTAKCNIITRPGGKYRRVRASALTTPSTASQAAASGGLNPSLGTTDPALPRLLVTFTAPYLGPWSGCPAYQVKCLARILATCSGRRAVAVQTIAAVCTLHSSGLMHRDIKANNILVSAVNVGTVDSPVLVPRVVLADLGTIKAIPPLAVGGTWGDSRDCMGLGLGASACPSSSYIAHRYYRAPELLLGNTVYDEKADVFSLGVVLAELWLGRALLSETQALPRSEPDGIRGDSTYLVLRTTLFGIPSVEETGELLHGIDPELAAATNDLFDACREPTDRFTTGSNFSGAHHADDRLRPRSLLLDYLKRCGMPIDVASCIAGMLEWSPRRRLSAQEALRHSAWAAQG